MICRVFFGLGMQNFLAIYEITKNNDFIYKLQQKLSKKQIFRE